MPAVCPFDFFHSPLRLRSVCRPPASGCLSEQSDNSNRAPSDSYADGNGQKGISRHGRIVLCLRFYPLSRAIHSLSRGSFFSLFFFFLLQDSHLGTVHSGAYCPVGLFSYLRRRSSETFISGLSPEGSLS